MDKPCREEALLGTTTLVEETLTGKIVGVEVAAMDAADVVDAEDEETAFVAGGKAVTFGNGDKSKEFNIIPKVVRKYTNDWLFN